MKEPGDLVRWSVRFDGRTYGADSVTGQIMPLSLADYVKEHEGEERVTYYRKPYTLSRDNAQSVYDFFDSEIDPQGRREQATVWVTVPGPEADEIP